MPKSLKLASDGEFQLTNRERNEAFKKLYDERGPLTFKSLLGIRQLVGCTISSYTPGADDIAFISSAELLKPYLIAAREKVSPPTSARRVLLIPLLKLATFRMAAQDRWNLACFWRVTIKNGIKAARSIKRGTSQ